MVKLFVIVQLAANLRGLQTEFGAELAELWQRLWHRLDPPVFAGRPEVA